MLDVLSLNGSLTKGASSGNYSKEWPVKHSVSPHVNLKQFNLSCGWLASS